MRAVVVANGELGLDRVQLAQLLGGADLLVAADGGAAAILAAGRRPDVAVGDFDSLDSGLRDVLTSGGTQVVALPSEKDQTDLELALLLAAERGARVIDVLGALGGPRLDHAVGNLLLLALPELAGHEVTLIDGRHELFLLAGKAERSVGGRPGDYVSLVPLTGEATGVTTEGLRYRLRGETLHIGRTRGISNELVASSGSISVDGGRLLVGVHHRHEVRNADA